MEDYLRDVPIEPGRGRLVYDKARKVIAAEKPPTIEGRETVALWMMGHGYATGHGDTIEDLLGELEAQAKERGALRELKLRGEAGGTLGE